MFQNDDIAKNQSVNMGGFHRPWRATEIDKLRAKIRSEEDAYTDANGIRRWRANDRAIPIYVIEKDACMVPSQAQRDADEAETAAFIASYRESRKNRVLSDEERFEMRAAFGPGETVVDVFTGQTWRT